MKKILLIITIGLLISCSPDSHETDTNNKTADLSLIVNPDTSRAAQQFDNLYKGLYKGVFVSYDATFHGILTVNLGNDGRYNAVLVLENGTKIGFLSSALSSENTTHQYYFEGNEGGFSLDVSDYNNPIVQNAVIDGQIANAKLLKETSTNRVMVDLGTFADDLDASYNGTWDLLSTSTRVIMVPTPGAPVNVTVNNISEVVLTRNGVMFTDNTMESFTPGAGCGAALPPGNQMPFFSGEQTIMVTVPGIPFPVPVQINEYGVANQTSNFGGQTTTWSFIYTKANGDLYYDIDCNAIPAGVWSRNGRSGSILLI